MSKVKPITPKEVVGKKTSGIPDFVLEAFNMCIAKHWDGRSSNFTQNEVVENAIENAPPEEQEDTVDLRRRIYENRWLDVERIYERAGWKVEYDKPGYCENYEANFTFRKRATRG